MSEPKLGNPDGAVTLQNVADKAGVSVMTVSRALSGEGYVAEKTRARVLAVVSDLGYSPNISARMMRGSRTNVIGVLVNDLQSTVINEIIGAVSLAVRNSNLDLIIYNSIEELGASNRSGINQIMRGLCDGLLFILPRLKEGYIDMLEQSSLPMVLINYCRTETTLPVVRGDNRAGGREAVRHLLELGHRRIAFIGGSAHTGQSQERQRGYADALKAAGIGADKQLVAAGDFGQLSGFEATRALLALDNPPTAVFAANDEMAFGAMDAVRARGLRVPEDVSVIGFDDIPAASHVHPKLSTLRQPLTAISEAAVHELLRRIAGNGAQHRVEFPSQLVVRESTGPAPGVGKAGRARRSAAKN